MFASRTRWDRRPNRLAQLVEQQRRAGRSLLDLTESNPTAAGLLAPPDLLQALSDPAGRHYAPTARGLDSARRAVAEDFARRGVALDPDHLLLTASSSEAYAWLFKLLCDPGDEILVPRPSYPLFEYLAGLECLHVRRYPLAYDGAWHLDFHALEALVGPRTRAVVVVHPNNPTGSYLTRAEAARLGELAAAHGLALVSDEVFADYAWRPDARRCLSLVHEPGPALAFALGGLSKSCGLPQLKLGWIAVAGPPALRDEALARLEIVADTYLSVATPVQCAAPRVLRRLPELQAPIAARVAANRRRLAEALTPAASATLLHAGGGWYAVLHVPATRSEEERVCALVEERQLLVHPGYFFDFEREAYLVLSLLPAERDFAAGLQRLLPTLAA